MNQAEILHGVSLYVFLYWVKILDQSEFGKKSQIMVNKGCTNSVIYFLLTCGLPICLGFFSYKDVVASFGNFLVLQVYLMGNNIVFMCGMDSILMWNPYGVWKQLLCLYYNRNLLLNKFPSQLKILYKQGN